MDHSFAKKYADQIIAGQLKQPKHKIGVVTAPLIDFIKPSHYIFSQLHFEFGAANNVIDNFHCFIEEEIELLSKEEKTARKSVILADVSLEKAKTTNGGSVDLSMYRMEKVHVNVALKVRHVDQDTRNDSMEQKRLIEERIEGLHEEQKQLEHNITVKKKHLKDAKDALRKIQSEKTKMDIPTVVAMENLFSENGITPAKNHGGKLNGVDCCEVMSHAKILFEEIEALLLSVLHTDQCSDAQFKHE